MQERKYVCIDLKSFYASVECVERNLNPLTTNLVVADISRTEKTICLAVSPSLKSFGIKGRPRLFEVNQKVKEINYNRKKRILNKEFIKKSYSLNELFEHDDYELDFVIARPQMAKYIEISTKIYNIYLRYIAPEDIHVYSIDEVFIDISKYLKLWKMTPHELTLTLIKDVLANTGITATAGIGSNMFLAKVAMDIVAKHIPPDSDGVRIAELDELLYRKKLWNHTPLTDFWRVGRGYEARLNKLGLYTMGDIARCSLGNNNDYYNEDLLYKEFGVNAELLIDHAWGYEVTTMEDIKSYKPSNNSLSTGQVLQCGYDYDKARLIVKEMVDLLALDLVKNNVLTNYISLYIGYDADSLKDENILKNYHGEYVLDHYNRKVPKPTHGGVKLSSYTFSSKVLTENAIYIFEKIVNPLLLVRRINISVSVFNENMVSNNKEYEQMNLFTDYNEIKKKEELEKKKLNKEKKVQKTILSIKSKYGKNAILKGMNLSSGATTKERNEQIGGHKA